MYPNWQHNRKPKRTEHTEQLYISFITLREFSMVMCMTMFDLGGIDLLSCSSRASANLLLRIHPRHAAVGM